MRAKRRIRFSIGAMLVVMTAVAVLLSHEVRRANAIEKTVQFIGQGRGHLKFRTRSNLLNPVAKVLPQYWTQEIDEVNVGGYDPRELQSVLELGAMDHVRSAVLFGYDIHKPHVTRIFRSPSMKYCLLVGVSLSKDEIASLKLTYPRCTVDVISDGVVVK